MGDQTEKRLRSGKPDRRREPREPLSGAVTILYEDQLGREMVGHAQLLDGSVNGARLRVQHEVPLRSPVIFHHNKLGVGGRGTVRYCNWSSLGFEIGVEFCQGKDWRNPFRNEALDRLRAAVDGQEQATVPLEADKTK